MKKPADLRTRIAQLIFPRLGSFLNPICSADEAAERIEFLLKDVAIGGLVLFNGSLESTPATLIRLQKASKIPLLIAADMERGAGQQLAGATVFPHALAFQHSSDYIESAAHAMALEALKSGIHITFSPVADIHSNARNPIISLRAFGTTADDVSEKVQSYLLGASSAGIFTTIKHFPGHGDTHSDSHFETPVVSLGVAELRDRELAPFRAAIQSGVDLVMTAHVSYPALDSSGAIATASSIILKDILRAELGFEGVIVSDSLLMAGSGDESESDKAMKLLQAGVDILLDIDDVSGVVDGLVENVESNALSSKTVDESFERVWNLKLQMIDRFGAGFFVAPENLVSNVTDPETSHHFESLQMLSSQVADEACQIISGHIDSARMDRKTIADDGLFVLHFGAQVRYDDPTIPDVGELFRIEFGNVRYHYVHPESDETHSSIVAEAQAAGAVVVLVTAKPSAWQQFGLSDRQLLMARSVLNNQGVVLAFLGLPLPDLEDSTAALTFCTWSDVTPSVAALVRRIAKLSELT